MHWQSLLPASQTDLVFANAHFIVNSWRTFERFNIRLIFGISAGV
jgi:hypothetical protein